MQFVLQSLTCTSHPFAALLQVGRVATVFTGGIDYVPADNILQP